MTGLGILLLFSVGLFLSALFSGSETGFYRASRLRLQLAAIGGDRLSRYLLWLTNNPSLFVATTLIGNNLANFLTSMAVVLGAHTLFPGLGPSAETVGPILLTPLIFIYGELMPKNLFYAAPNALLRRSAPLFLFFNLLFAPAAALLWFLGRCLQRLVGEAPEQVRLRLAREDLMGVFEEGHEAGLLKPAQRRLAQDTFHVANEAVSRLVTPVGRHTCVFPTMEKTDVLRLARRQRRPVILVLDAKSRRIIGHVRVVDVYLANGDWLEATSPVTKINSSTSHLAALIQLQTEKQPIAEVVNEKDESLGVITLRRLRDPLLGRV